MITYFRRYGFITKIVSLFIVTTFLSPNLVLGQGNISVGTLRSVSPLLSFDRQLESLHLLNVQIPENLGKLKETWRPREGENTRTILHIQDSHANYEAQMNIAKILENIIPVPKTKNGKNHFLNGKKPPILVAVEGASSPIDTTMIREFPDEKIKWIVSDHLVKKGLLTGSELYSAFTNSNVIVHGVEDREIYIKNIELFKQVQRSKKDVQGYVNLLGGILNKSMQGVFSEKQDEFITRLISYHGDELGLEGYIKYLSPSITEKHPNLGRLLEMIKLKEKIDFKKIDTERLRLLKRLKRKLTNEDIVELVTAGLNYQVGKLSALDYFTYLKGFIKDNPADLRHYPNLIPYVDYVKIESRVDRNLLFKEITALEEQIQEELFRGTKEKALFKKLKALYLLKNFLELKIYREDLNYYKGHKYEFFKLWDIIPEEKRTLTSANLIESFLKIFEFFCDVGIQRDHILMENTIKKMEELNTNTAILITGGFHTDGVTQLMKEKNISYAVISPRMTKVDHKKKYISLMLQEKSPLDKILEFHGTRVAIPFNWEEAQAVNKATADIARLMFKTLAGGLLMFRKTDLEKVQKVLQLGQPYLELPPNAKVTLLSGGETKEVPLNLIWRENKKLGATLVVTTEDKLAEGRDYLLVERIKDENEKEITIALAPEKKQKSIPFIPTEEPTGKSWDEQKRLPPIEVVKNNIVFTVTDLYPFDVSKPYPKPEGMSSFAFEKFIKRLFSSLIMLMNREPIQNNFAVKGAIENILKDQKNKGVEFIIVKNGILGNQMARYPGIIAIDETFYEYTIGGHKLEWGGARIFIERLLHELSHDNEIGEYKEEFAEEAKVLREVDWFLFEVLGGVDEELETFLQNIPKEEVKPSVSGKSKYTYFAKIREESLAKPEGEREEFIRKEPKNYASTVVSGDLRRFAKGWGGEGSETESEFDGKGGVFFGEKVRGEFIDALDFFFWAGSREKIKNKAQGIKTISDVRNMLAEAEEYYKKYKNRIDENEEWRKNKGYVSGLMYLQKARRLLTVFKPSPSYSSYINRLLRDVTILVSPWIKKEIVRQEAIHDLQLLAKELSGSNVTFEVPEAIKNELRELMGKGVSPSLYTENPLLLRDLASELAKQSDRLLDELEFAQIDKVAGHLTVKTGKQMRIGDVSKLSRVVNTSKEFVELIETFQGRIMFRLPSFKAGQPEVLSTLDEMRNVLERTNIPNGLSLSLTFNQENMRHVTIDLVEENHAQDVIDSTEQFLTNLRRHIEVLQYFQVNTPEDIRQKTGQYPAMAEAYSEVTVHEYFNSTAGSGLTEVNRRVALEQLAIVAKSVVRHFSKEGYKVETVDEGLKLAARAQYIGYLSGVLNRELGIEEEQVWDALNEYFEKNGDINILRNKLGLTNEYLKNNGWMFNGGLDDSGNWSFWGFGTADIALNLPGVYAGLATLDFANALTNGAGQELLDRLLSHSSEEIEGLLQGKGEPQEAALAAFAVRAAQLGWLISKLGQGIVEAHNPKKEAQSIKRWAPKNDLITNFDRMAEKKGWKEVAKYIDQTKAYARYKKILTKELSDSRGFEGLPNDVYTEEIRTALNNRQFASARLNSSNVFEQVDFELDTGEPIRIDKQIRLTPEHLGQVNSIITQLELQALLKGITIVFCDGKEHYGVGREQIYLNIGLLQNPKELMKRLVHELIERTDIREGLPERLRKELERTATKPGERSQELKNEIERLGSESHDRLKIFEKGLDLISDDGEFIQAIKEELSRAQLRWLLKTKVLLSLPGEAYLGWKEGLFEDLLNKSPETVIKMWMQMKDFPSDLELIDELDKYPKYVNIEHKLINVYNLLKNDVKGTFVAGLFGKLAEAISESLEKKHVLVFDVDFLVKGTEAIGYCNKMLKDKNIKVAFFNLGESKDLTALLDNYENQPVITSKMLSDAKAEPGNYADAIAGILKQYDGYDSLFVTILATRNHEKLLYNKELTKLAEVMIIDALGFSVNEQLVIGLIREVFNVANSINPDFTRDMGVSFINEIFGKYNIVEETKRKVILDQLFDNDGKLIPPSLKKGEEAAERIGREEEVKEAL